MVKFHINDKGVPSVCKATKGNCPFGGPNTHYKTKKEAQIEVDRRNEAEFSLLPGSKNKKITSKKPIVEQKTHFRNATKKDKEYMQNRKNFLKHESKTPTYIEKCRSCERLDNPSFYEENKVNTHHFENDRKGRANKLEDIYGKGESVGFYEVNHKTKGANYRKQVIEIKDTGQLIVYDKNRGHVVTTFMGHRARVETMLILAGEIPDTDFMSNVTKNHTADLKRQAIDKKYGVA